MTTTPSTAPPWREIPSGHVLHPYTGPASAPTTTVLGTPLDVSEYRHSCMRAVRNRFPRNFERAPLMAAPDSPAWIGFVYALMAQHADFSFDERRAFARGGVNAIFGPFERGGLAMAINFWGHSDHTLHNSMAAAAHAKRIPVKTRRTFAGLRDAMSLPALVDLLCMLTKPDTLMLNVLRDGKMVAGSVGESTVFTHPAYAEQVKRGDLWGLLFSASAFADDHGVTAINYLATLDVVCINEIVGHIAPKHQSRASVCLHSLVSSAKLAVGSTTTATTTTTTETKTMTAAKPTFTEAADVLDAILARNIPEAATTIATYLKAIHEEDGSTAPSELADLRILTEVVFNALKGCAPHGHSVHSRAMPSSATLDSIAGLLLICRTTESAWAKLDTTAPDAVAQNEVISRALTAAGGASSDEPEDADVETEAPATVARPTLSPDPKVSAMLDAVLSSAGLPSIADIDKMIGDAHEIAAAREAEVERLRKSAAAAVVPTVSVVASGETPSGKTVAVTADKLFAGAKGLTKADLAKLSKLTVPCFEWDGPHPLVPAVEDHYIFRMDSLLPLLFALVANKKPWIQGHTGSGKSTLVTQVAARLKWPVVRVNFDSDISRLDLVGRDTLTTDPASGTTITKWVDGVLPMALRGPHILLLDEIDFVRPDVSYVLQPILEGNPLVLNENGGERVVPDALCRIVATANTVGQGDEFGMYQGARPQSAAMLDRFSCFIKVPYLSTEQEVALIKAKHPTLPVETANTIGRYVTEHREAFTKASILMPISPRGIDAVAEHCVTFTNVLGDPVKALKMAFDVTLLAKASEQDRSVIAGLLKRVMK